MGFLYFVFFLQEQNNFSLNLTRTSLNVPNGKLKKKKNYVLIFGLALRFWVFVNKTTSVQLVFDF